MIEHPISEGIVEDEIIESNKVINKEVEVVKEIITPEVKIKPSNQEVKKNRTIKTKSNDFGNIVLKPK